MPKFAANLSFLFQDIEFFERFAAAADCGFHAVEYLFPYDYPAEELKQALAAHRLEQALFNLPPGDWDAGERGLAALPGREAEFGDALGQALGYAEALGRKRLSTRLIQLQRDYFGGHGFRHVGQEDLVHGPWHGDGG